MSSEKLHESEFVQPTVSEIIKRLLSDGIISQENADKYMKNYDFFQDQREDILQNQESGKWVGSVNGKIIKAHSLKELRDLMKQEPDSNRGYIEQIGG